MWRRMLQNGPFFRLLAFRTAFRLARPNRKEVTSDVRTRTVVVDPR